MVSNVDLSVVVHFGFSISSNALSIEQQFLKDLNTWTLIALLEEAVRYHVHVIYQKNQVYKMLF